MKTYRKTIEKSMINKVNKQSPEIMIVLIVTRSA